MMKESGTVASISKEPWITILDPNDPEGAYQQMMEQYRKHQESDDSQE
jgi:hypothetical protein